MDSSEENDGEILDNEDFMDADDLFGEDEEDGQGDEDDKGSGKKSGKQSNKDGKGGAGGEKKSTTRRVSQPRLVLNLDRLKSEHGIPALMETFEKFTFKGKNHEKEDLTAIINSLQHWMCHHLYPGYDAVTCMKILEKLGKKRVVQTHMRRLRSEAREAVLKREERKDELEDVKIESSMNSGSGPERLEENVDLSQFEDGFDDGFPDCENVI